MLLWFVNLHCLSCLGRASVFELEGCVMGWRSEGLWAGKTLFSWIDHPLNLCIQVDKLPWKYECIMVETPLKMVGITGFQTTCWFWNTVEMMLSWTSKTYCKFDNTVFSYIIYRWNKPLRWANSDISNSVLLKLCKQVLAAVFLQWSCTGCLEQFQTFNVLIQIWQKKKKWLVYKKGNQW